MDGFDFSELEELEEDLLRVANETMPKESKKFLRKEALKVRKQARGGLRTAYKKKTGNLVKMVKPGRSYLYTPERAYQIRVHMAYHENVVDYGHTATNGREVRGKRVKDRVEAFFSDEFTEDVEKFIDEMLEEGLG